METNNIENVPKKRGRKKQEDLEHTMEVDTNVIREKIEEEKSAPKSIVYSTPEVVNNSVPVSNKKYITVGQLVAMMVITVIVTILLGAGGILFAFHVNPDLLSTKNTTMNITKTEKEVTVTDEGIADAVEKVWDSTVVVETYKNNKLYATGSGFIYKKDNDKYYLLTNYHVIQSGNKIKVVLSNGKREEVTVVGGDKYVDIAVLSYSTKEDLKVAEIGSSVNARVGDTVFAIGAPLDSSVYSWTVTRGVLSGKDREVEVSTGDSYYSDWIMQVLQTDAAINSGNSGGPLCNSNGQVIGITNMKLVTTGVEGMGFAIPIEEAISYADSVIGGKDMSRPYIGVSMQDVTSSSYGNSDVSGVYVIDVEQGSPADKAGLRSGDIIIAMDDYKIVNVASLRYKLYSYKVGDKVKITYTRDGREGKVDLTLGANKNSNQ